MRLFDRHQIKHINSLRFLVNPENDRIGSPNMHPINLCLLMETFYIGCIVGIFEFIEVVKDMFPDIHREFL